MPPYYFDACFFAWRASRHFRRARRAVRRRRWPSAVTLLPPFERYATRHVCAMRRDTAEMRSHAAMRNAIEI
jgi:hypothetical protein